MQVEDDAQGFQNVQPVFCLFLIDVRILCDLRNIQHLRAAGGNGSHKTQKFQRINGIGKLFYVTFNIGRKVAAVKNLAVGIFSACNSGHGTPIDTLKDTFGICGQSFFLSFQQSVQIYTEWLGICTVYF